MLYNKHQRHSYPGGCLRLTSELFQEFVLQELQALAQNTTPPIHPAAQVLGNCLSETLLASLSYTLIVICLICKQLVPKGLGAAHQAR